MIENDLIEQYEELSGRKLTERDLEELNIDQLEDLINICDMNKRHREMYIKKENKEITQEEYDKFVIIYNKFCDRVKNGSNN